MLYRPKNGQAAWILVSARPLRGPKGEITGGVSIFRDITERKRYEEESAARTAQLAQSEQEKSQLIERLRAAVDELATPVLELWDDVLALPVMGVVDSQRSAEMTERLLAETARSQARFVIVDLTGVEVVDTATADRLLKLAQSVELLGARCFVTGIQPAVAQTIVELGVEFGKFKAMRNLKHALKLSMALGSQDQANLE
jgi:rsbT co-antagonist protein RsbR